MALIDTDTMTPAEIATVLYNESLLDGVKAIDEYPVTVDVLNDGLGRVKKWDETMRDLNGDVIQIRTDIYTYYPTGEVNIIVQIVRNAVGDDLRPQIEIKHFTDGSPPVVTEV